jgi:predicted helicase
MNTILGQFFSKKPCFNAYLCLFKTKNNHAMYALKLFQDSNFDEMSLKAIQQYHNEIHKIKRLSKQDSEQVLRKAFAHLLEAFAAKYNLTLLEEVSFRTPAKNLIRFDGVLKNELSLDFGHWEAKARVDLEDEIRKKFNKGYPKQNILFEDGIQAVLYQDGERVANAIMAEPDDLNNLLQQFFAYETTELRDFKQAVADFKKDVPTIVENLRKMIQTQAVENQAFITKRFDFLAICQQAINPDIGFDEVDEMLIQHILTEQIFIAVFSDEQLVRENNIAQALSAVENTFFKGAFKRNVLDKIKNYYEVIAAAARRFQGHTEKQTFLKKVYENFYKAYNPKGADKLGIVYTPSEIVQFQIKATDYLLETHFGKTLSDKGVQILDPATGTGTYLCDLIDYLNPRHLLHKFKHELFANEVSILPYYIANLNIEYTFRNKMEHYESFDHLCFVDTLDNVSSLGWTGKQMDMFSLSAENAKRIKIQNEAKISVIIGNPPYNANQQNENDNNKNRTYPFIDKRIKETFVAKSSAQKTKVYDMYARFFRWAMDRLDQNGVISFITNRSFIDSRTFDGFRACVQQDFNDVYIIDLQSDVRANPKIAGTTHNVFGIQTGVAILFLVKKKMVKTTLKQPCRIFYHALDDFWKKEAKLDYLRENEFQTFDFQRIIPDKNNNWINLSEDNDWESLMPICDKEVKNGKSGNAIFELYSLGVVTNRDEWVYDFNGNDLKQKVLYLIDIYNKEVERLKHIDKNKIKDEVDTSIKWTRAVKNDLSKNKIYNFDNKQIIKSLYRPFVKQSLYFNKSLNEMQYQTPIIWGENGQFDNKVIFISGTSSMKSFQTLMTDTIAGLDFLEKTQSLPMYTYDANGNRQENITDWALEQFQQHYCHSVGNSITKEKIFYYVYAVLHAPAYRSAYEINLKRDFPRIPFHADFEKYAALGKQLADLHIGYENIAPYPLQRIDKETGKDFVPQAKLKADKTNHYIEIDEITKLYNVPEATWDYKLGNRSALEWVLDQYKPSKPSDPTIAAQFNTYQFADYKEQVIDLLQKVCRVSVETMQLMEQL